MAAMPLVGPYRMINLVEGCFWIAIGVAVAIVTIRRREARARLVLMAIALAAFGVSDFVEVQTGAWWRPWWMLSWKAACVIAIAGLGVAHWRARRATGPSGREGLR